MAAILSLSEIQYKIKNYCAYQERSHAEVKQKLFGLGLLKTDMDKVINWLTENNYLNDERFAIRFAAGKFRMKKWGRIKIKQALQQRKINAQNISTALEQIDEAAYLKVLQSLASAKWRSLKTDTVLIKKVKTMRYLQQKGYENNLVQQTLAKLAAKQAYP